MPGFGEITQNGRSSLLVASCWLGFEPLVLDPKEKQKSYPAQLRFSARATDTQSRSLPKSSKQLMDPCPPWVRKGPPPPPPHFCNDMVFV